MHVATELKAGQRILFTDILHRRLFGVVRYPTQNSTFYVVETNRGLHLITPIDVVAVV